MYAKSLDPSERGKRDVAEALLNRDDCVVSVQVLQEFYVQSTRATRPHRLDLDIAQEIVRGLRRLRVVDMSVDLFFEALELSNRYHFSYWDSAIIAAALIAKCDTLFTEDLHHGQIIDGLKIVNPFKDD
ncbi:PIN domain-containing protein [Rhizobium sp. LjRoot254]